MAEPTDEQIAKLPKWAQDHIAYLAGRLRYETQTAIEVTEGQTPIRWTRGVEEWRHVPDGATVRFMLDERHYVDAFLRRAPQLEMQPKDFGVRSPEEIFLELRVGGGFHHRLVFLSEAVNCGHITSRY